MTVLIAEYLEHRLQSMTKSLSEARIINMGSTRTCQLYVIPREPSIMHPEGDFYVLKMDVELLVASPSAAASFCTGTAMQGTTAWVDAEDKTFSSVFK